ncbi:hypothetical protein HYH03_018895 [Edaphochlamys debaryana]|uniref:Glycosyl transferase CAP10 domain-containing protein n=1 Tax=Edaphochlamys debaryana TaxID=47281 RepID=A0A835XGX7_9CHLO|nr:hypothetical protein HYH03_018895 [Edaphochlamys debaryana]|eukprot:KAG2482151.1 hypothetical protein HYH03_018895 [Edaphochlamys debaryana]
MSWSRHNPGQHDLLLPYFSTLEIERFATGFFEPVPWEQRQPVAVWRGSANGCRYAKDTWRQCVRARAVLACLQPGSHCDAGFLRAQARATPEGMADMAAAGVYRDALPFQAMSRYRYVLVIDGNSATSRLGPLLFSNTTILKQASPITEFFYGSLRPFVHYVPFSNTAEDLLSVIEWVRNNDAAAREIAANAYRWAVTHLSGRSVADYVGTMLNAYGRLQRFEPTLTPDLAPWRVVPVGGFLPTWEATADKGRCGGVRQAAGLVLVVE